MLVRRFSELAFQELSGRRSADALAGWDAPVSVRVVRLDPGETPRRPHRHPRSVEVVHVVEGAGRVWQDGEVRRVGVGDLLLVPRGAAHATVPDADSSLLLVCFFPDPDLASNVEELDTPLTLD
ncbi:MAG: cupin domain-containing protein [Carbonactinosporaceae bacterium]